VIKASEDIEDDLWDELDDHHESLGEEEQKLIGASNNFSIT